MSHGEVLEENADQIKLFKHSYEGRIPLNYDGEQFQAEKWHGILISQDHAILREELLQDQLIDGLRRISVFLRIVDLLFAKVLRDIVCEKLEGQETDVGRGRFYLFH